MKKILVIDNYDSFTYNLVHLLLTSGEVSVDVLRNDKLSLETPAGYDKLVFSPGPGIPEEAGLMCRLIREYAGKKPILGVCLGHQAIGEVFGSKLRNLSRVYHGIATDVFVKTDDYIFNGMKPVFKAGRYHSWVIDENDLSPQLELLASDKEGMIMAVRHKTYDIRGLQFHPESVLTEQSDVLMRNWVNY